MQPSICLRRRLHQIHRIQRSHRLPNLPRQRRHRRLIPIHRHQHMNPPCRLIPLAGQVNSPFLGSIRAEVIRATSCIFVSLFRPSALKFSADTPKVCCTSGVHTAIPAFDELLVEGFGLLVRLRLHPSAQTRHTKHHNSPSKNHDVATRKPSFFEPSGNLVYLQHKTPKSQSSTSPAFNSSLNQGTK